MAEELKRTLGNTACTWDGRVPAKRFTTGGRAQRLLGGQPALLPRSLPSSHHLPHSVSGNRGSEKWPPLPRSHAPRASAPRPGLCILGTNPARGHIGEDRPRSPFWAATSSALLHQATGIQSTSPTSCNPPGRPET